MILGTRGSALARIQAALAAAAVGGDVETRVIRTTGDASARPLHELGDGIFVGALEDALRRGEIDVAVHSLKDLPTGDRPGLTVGAVLERADPRDVLVTTARGGLDTLVPHARVGTSSPRRDAALRAVRPDIETLPIRGNVDTRLAKVARGEYDATVLALAGLVRLEIAVAEHEIISTAVLLPAPGQGAIALQCRADDRATRERLARADHGATRTATDCEREVLRLLGASCDLALGALATVSGGRIALEAALDGRRTTATGSDAIAVAREAAAALGIVPVA